MAKTSNARANRIKDWAPYRESEERLARLKSALEAAALRLSKATLRVNRTEKLRNYHNMLVRVFPSTTEIEFDKIALQIAADGEIPEALMKRLRAAAPQPPFDDTDDLGEINEANDARRSVDLLNRAIALQEREVSRQKNLAIAEVCGATRDERARIALKIAGAVLNLATAVSEEKVFVEGLRSDDAAIIPMLRPLPFPVELNSNPALCRWVSLALGISEADVQARMSNPNPMPPRQMEKAAPVQ